MKTLYTILLLFSIILSDCAVGMLSFFDHETILVDFKSETENESENEKEGEFENDKELVDDSMLRLSVDPDLTANQYSRCISKDNENYLEIYLPPPDYI